MIKKLLKKNANERLSANDALKHPWFNEETPHEYIINKDVLQRLQEFRGVSMLKKAAMNMLVKMADQSKIENLKAEF